MCSTAISVDEPTLAVLLPEDLYAMTVRDINDTRGQEPSRDIEGCVAPETGEGKLPVEKGKRNRFLPRRAVLQCYGMMRIG